MTDADAAWAAYDGVLSELAVMQMERDEARAEVARLRAQVAAVAALCDELQADGDDWTPVRVRAALAEHTGEASS